MKKTFTQFLAEMQSAKILVRIGAFIDDLSNDGLKNRIESRLKNETDPKRAAATLMDIQKTVQGSTPQGKVDISAINSMVSALTQSKDP